MRFATSVVTLGLTVACGGSHEQTIRESKVPPTGVSPRSDRVGDIRTFLSNREIGHETYRDDGDTLRSLVRFRTTEHRIELSRSTRSVRCDDDQPISLDSNTVALENGHWQAYAIAAERFAHATTPIPVRLVLPCSQVTAEASILVVPDAMGTLVVVNVGALSVRVLIDSRRAFVSGAVPAQGVVARAKHDPAAEATPNNVVERAVSVVSGGVVLSGTEWIPRDVGGRPPVALIVAGSGPTDRDGNSSLGVTSDTYRLLAAALANHGIASVRYDKRGVGMSERNLPAKAFTMKDFVDDALAWVDSIRRDTRFGKLTLVGHSEGGLIVTLAATRVECDGLVLLASPGRPIDVVLREQLSVVLSPTEMTEYERIVAALRNGGDVGSVPEVLAPVFAGSGGVFIASLLGVDPAAELARAKSGRVTIIQGTTDLQVTLEDAEFLYRAHPGADLKVVANMNHVLKAEPRRVMPQLSYADPTRSLAPGLVDSVVTGVAR
jgi:alpha-beta hydrolase superfamily lysophospholipase